MRILFVTNMYPSAERPGYGAFVEHQAEGLRRHGHVVDVLEILGSKSKLNYAKAAVEVRRRTVHDGFDIVHAHYGLSAFPASCRRATPLVITLHGSDVLGSRLERSLTRAICRLADAVIVVSEEMRRWIPGTVVPCGVDLSVFTPHDRAEARRRLGLPTHALLVLFPFDPARRVKRYDLARAAVSQLEADGLDVRLVSVSGVHSSEMPWYYSASNAMILCSEREGSPTSVKEALACDLPVVATPVGDLCELFTGIPGTRLCQPNVADLARGLRDVLTEPPGMGFRGRQAMARYDQTHTIARIVDVYASVLR